MVYSILTIIQFPIFNIGYRDRIKRTDKKMFSRFVMCLLLLHFLSANCRMHTLQSLTKRSICIAGIVLGNFCSITEAVENSQSTTPKYLEVTPTGTKETISRPQVAIPIDTSANVPSRPVVIQTPNEADYRFNPSKDNPESFETVLKLIPSYK